MCDTEDCRKGEEIDGTLRRLAEFVWEKLVQQNCEHYVNCHCNIEEDVVLSCDMKFCPKFEINEHW